MKKLQKKKEAGFLVTIEMIFIATILVIGLVVGWTILRDAVTGELNDVAEAVGGLDQSYSFDGIVYVNGGGVTVAQVSGTTWNDSTDSLAGDTIDPIYGVDDPTDNNEQGTF